MDPEESVNSSKKIENRTVSLNHLEYISRRSYYVAIKDVIDALPFNHPYRKKLETHWCNTLFSWCYLEKYDITILPPPLPKL